MNFVWEVVERSFVCCDPLWPMVEAVLEKWAGWFLTPWLASCFSSFPLQIKSEFLVYMIFLKKII